MPVLIRPTGVETVGYSNDHPGGYGEFMRLTEKLLLEVPNGLATERAALTEPLAVGYHAVAKARMEKDDAPLVIGCGPVGLAVIAALKLKGVHPIVAADFSPRRRALAQEMGADVVVDPKEKSPYESWRELAAYGDPARAPQLPPWMPGPALRPAVIFECVGVPGVIETIMAAAPAHARMVVVGVCMERDHIEPLFGINKELNLQFVLGYTGEEFADHVAQPGGGQGQRRSAGDREGRSRRASRRRSRIWPRPSGTRKFWSSHGVAERGSIRSPPESPRLRNGRGGRGPRAVPRTNPRRRLPRAQVRSRR